MFHNNTIFKNSESSVLYFDAKKISKNKNKALNYVDGRGYVQSPQKNTSDSAFFNSLRLSALCLLLVITLRFLFEFILNGTASNKDYFNGAVSPLRDNIGFILRIFSFVTAFLIPLAVFFKAAKIPVSGNILKGKNKSCQKSCRAFTFGACLLGAAAFQSATIAFAAFSPIGKVAESFFSNKNLGFGSPLLRFAMCLIWLIVFSVLKELFCHTAMLKAFGQFGDGVAILTTAVVSALISENLSNFLAEFYITLLSGYAIIKSGSVFKGIFIKLLFYMLCCTSYCLVSTVNKASDWLTINIVLTVFCAVLGIFILIILAATDGFSDVFKFRKLGVISVPILLKTASQSLLCVSTFLISLTIIIINTFINI